MDEPGALVDEALLEEDAEELYEHASVGYVSSLPNGRIVKVNETLLGWTGHTREELLEGRRLHDLLAPGAPPVQVDAAGRASITLAPRTAMALLASGTP